MKQCSVLNQIMEESSELLNKIFLGEVREQTVSAQISGVLSLMRGY